VSKTFGEWYQKANKTEDTNKLTLLAFKIIAILHNTRLATFIKLLETVSKGRTAVTRSWIAAVWLQPTNPSSTELKERVEIYVHPLPLCALMPCSKTTSCLPNNESHRLGNVTGFGRFEVLHSGVTEDNPESLRTGATGLID
jgi:hypothetical protein